MYMIVRLEERMDKNPKHPFDFTIIGRAMMLWRAFDENDLDGKYFFHDPEHWDSKSILISGDFCSANRLESVTA
jgi:hypothetical protein